MDKGGEYALEKIPHFNGDLFADVKPLELKGGEIDALFKVARLNWGDVDASIIGTLFERGLDPTKEAEIGTHYTRREDISAIVEPVVMAPLRREWRRVRGAVDDLLDQDAKRTTRGMRAKSSVGDPGRLRKARKLIGDFLHDIQEVTILDPACGSGNFLFVSLQKLKDLEKEVLVYASQRNVGEYIPLVGPSQLRGIEKNSYAYNLARMTIWIGWLQWTKANGYKVDWEPILRSLDNILNMDAVIDLADPEKPAEPDWPEAKFIVGNPPFLGNKRMRSELGREYCSELWDLYGDRIPATSDYCCYWFEKARALIEQGHTQAAGLLATTGIRQVGARRVLERIAESGSIFFAEPDRDWVLEGASVRISMIGFGPRSHPGPFLRDGLEVPSINADLNSGLDLSRKKELACNLGKVFMGVTKVGDFDVEERVAHEMLVGANPHGLPSSDVLRPFRNGSDVVRVCSNRWIIDFGVSTPEGEAALYEAPFEYLVAHVRTKRRENNRAAYSERWWIHAEARPGFRRATATLPRYLATARVAKHRVFVWLDSVILPDSKLIALALDDDFSFGVLHSRVHESWTLGNCGWHGGERSTYNPTTCFETFPFPEPFAGLQAEIGEAARKLDTARNNWLNPQEWTREEVLEFPGSNSGPWAHLVTDPDERGIGTVRYSRRVPKDDVCAGKLAKRTLTNLYNERPTWLDLAHRRLDEAVFAAYGWKPDLTDDEILARLLALNLERASAEAETTSAPQVVESSR